MTALRVAIAGAGYFAGLHRDAWERLPETTVVAVADRDIEKARATGYPAFAGIAGMLEDARPDILDLALPPAVHAEGIAAGIAAAVPTIVCQKPFCSSHQEAGAMTAQAEAAGVRLIVHENFRFQPWYRAIRRALEDERIGYPLAATMRLRPGDGQGPDAYLARQPYFRDMPRFLVHETGVHFVDVFAYLFGPPRSVLADLRRINPAIAGEDAGIVVFEHEGGLRAVFDGNRLLDHATDNPRRTMGEALVEGAGGTLTLTGDGAVHLRQFGRRESEIILGPDAAETFGGDCVYRFQAHVVSGLLRGTAIETGARDYLPVLRAEEAIYRSAETGCRVAL